ncbi:hypothetical protein RND81_03G090400 [Saponaria officinalis]|uniref:FAS1 domain-containing protein n=1 Tax=Saponaria officinalis TaxID=3572 RepID=A0AAW1M4Z7_SAPOF
MASPLTLFLTLLSLSSFLLPPTTSVSSPPSQPPQSPPSTTTTADLQLNNSPFTSLTTILSSLGYQNLALAAHTLSLPSLTTTAVPFLGPITVFAASDPSVSTCPTCSLPLLLQEHSIPGLYSSDYLSRLSFGTKIETLLPGRCLTLTSSANSSRLFIGGAELTFPDLFANSHIIIHGIQGFLSHLSPYSCSFDKFSSLFLHHTTASSSASTPVSTALTRMMLADAMIRLRTSGYSILALALRVKYPDLISLENMTIFAVDDSAIFHGGHAYVHSVRFHILPNKFLRYSDLERLPPATLLPTLEFGESLTVTSSGSGGLVSPMRINYVRVKFPDMLYNMKLVVHGLSSPFPRLSHVTAASTTRQISFASVGSSVTHQHSSDQILSPDSASSSVVQRNDDDDFDDDDNDVHQGL